MSDDENIEADDITFESTTTFTDLMREGDTLKTYIAKIVRHYMDKNNNDVLL